jgi:hypothetical protein
MNSGLQPIMKVLEDLFPWLDLNDDIDCHRITTEPIFNVSLTFDQQGIVDSLISITEEKGIGKIWLHTRLKKGIGKIWLHTRFKKRPPPENFALNSVPDAVGVVSFLLPQWKKSHEFQTPVFQPFTSVNPLDEEFLLVSPSGTKVCIFEGLKQKTLWMIDDKTAWATNSNHTSQFLNPGIVGPRKTKFKGVPLTIAGMLQL